MTCEKIWLITDEGQPLGLERSEDGVYREPVTVKMVFVQQRHAVDLSKQDEIEPIAPYHFKGRPLFILLSGIAVGIVAGGLMNIEPVISSIVVATFAICTVLFHSSGASEYRLLQIGENGKKNCIVASEEDISDLAKEFPDAFRSPQEASPAALTDKEKDQVAIHRYGFVTTLSALAFFALAQPLMRVFKGEADWVSTVFTPLVALAALVIAYIGAAKTGMRILKVMKSGHRKT